MGSTTGSSSRRRGYRRLLGGYGPLGLGVVLAIGVAAVAPSRVPDLIFNAGDVAVRQVPEGQAASGWGTSVTPCPDRKDQAAGLSYSPPCFAFSGDNGGATAPGVTGKEISVSYRLTAEGDVVGLLASMAGLPLKESTADLERTAEGLLDYFNTHFQFYGRKLKLKGYQGRGALLTELYGGGQEQATNDALKVSQELKAFADVTSLTQPYADALARNQVVSIGAPYMSRQWFTDRRPYAWSSLPDCTSVTEMATEYGNKRVFGRPARYAGDADLHNKRRKIALIVPDNLEYQQCADRGDQVLRKAGHKIDLRLDYTLDLAQAQATAPALLAKLIDNKVTSVAFAGDPFLLLALTGRAEAQHYHPEWMLLGAGFTDIDLVGQAIQGAAPGEWKGAFGGSALTAQPAPMTSEAFRAYKSVRKDNPSVLVDVIYQQLLPLALGVQMAGPDLTPENFETGLFAYPEHSGIAGAWDWSPQHYTPQVDIRFIRWDPKATSSFDLAPGSYVDDGKRYRRGEIPEGEPEVSK